MMRRVVSVWLPRWPIDRRVPAQGGATQATSSPFAAPDKPAALFVNERGCARLWALNAAAERAGLHRGDPVADARARWPDLVVAAAEPDADAAALERLAHWAGRWSPFVAPRRETDADWGLALDVTGVAHLFGGEGGLLADLLQRLQAAGVSAPHAAVADDLAVAWAAARFGPADAAQTRGVQVEAGASARAAQSWPVEALRLDDDRARRMRRLGLTRLADLEALPRAGLARRFGRETLARVDAVAGRAPTPLDPVAPPVEHRAVRRFAEPLLADEAVEAAAVDLAHALAAQLEGAGLGARRLTLTLYRVDGHARALAFGAARPVREGPVLARLVRDRLARAEIDPGFGIDALALSADLTGRLDADAPALSPDARALADAAAAPARLADRVAARLGEDAVAGLCVADAWDPDRALSWRPRAVAAPSAATPHRQAGASPIAPPITRLARREEAQVVALLPDGPPARVRWRKRLHAVARAQGPARVSQPWWTAPDPSAPAPPDEDHFLVETRDGLRLALVRTQGPDGPRWSVRGAG